MAQRFLARSRAVIGVELAVIDESTTVHGFADALRWNNGHYRMAQGF